MSLINQMLKDLEERSQPKLKPEVALMGLYATRAKKKLLPSWFLWLSVMTFLLFTFSMGRLLMNHFIHNKHAIYEKLNDFLPIGNSSSPDAASQHISPTVLTGITLQVQQTKTTLRFSLSQNSLYRVDYDDKRDQLIIFLDHAHIIASLPGINYDNTAIRSMSIGNQTNGDLKIVIGLKKGAEINGVALNEEGKFPELKLDLLYQETSPSASAENTNSDLPQQFGSIKKLVVNMTVEEEYQKALNLFSVGGESKAVHALYALINKYPNYIPARESLAKYLLQRGGIKEADLLLQSSLTLYPTYLPFIEMRARILTETGKPREALALFKHAPVPTVSANPGYYAFVAALHQRLNEPMIAAKIYEQLISYDSTKALWWVGLGVALESLNKTREATQAYTKASESEGLTPELSSFIESRTDNV